MPDTRAPAPATMPASFVTRLQQAPGALGHDARGMACIATPIFPGPVRRRAGLEVQQVAPARFLRLQHAGPAPQIYPGVVAVVGTVQAPRIGSPDAAERALTLAVDTSGP